jgi:hypothetical protein
LGGNAKVLEGGLYSGFNLLEGVSLNPNFGAMFGFTYYEIINLYARQIENVSKDIKMDKEQLRTDMIA